MLLKLWFASWNCNLLRIFKILVKNISNWKEFFQLMYEI